MASNTDVDSSRSPGIHRRSLLKGVAQSLMAPAMVNLGRFQVFAQSPAKYSARAVDLVRSANVIDMLNPFSLAATLSGPDGKRGVDWLVNPASFTPADRRRFL